MGLKMGLGISVPGSKVQKLDTSFAVHPGERDGVGAGKGYTFPVTQGCLLAFRVPGNQIVRQEIAW